MNYLMLHRILGLALIAIADPPNPVLLTSSGISIQQQVSSHEYVIPSPDEDLPDQVK